MFDTTLAKIIEMTFDGRLSIIWIAIIALLVAAIYELTPWFIAYRADRKAKLNRKLWLIKHYPNSHKYLK